MAGSPASRTLRLAVVAGLAAAACRAVDPPRPLHLASPGLRTADAPVEAPAEPPSPEERPAWAGVLDRLKVFGDFRLRLESDFGRDSGVDRHRDRIRARIGAEYRLTDELVLGARLVTGDPSDPNSTHVTLGGGFDDLEVSFDRAFVTYRPEWLEGAFGTVGKFGHPAVRNPVYGELVWDADVQPEGAVVGHRLPDRGRWRSPSAVLGVYTYQEQSDDADSFLVAGQVSGGLEMTGETRATGAVGYYHYTDVSSPALFARNQGNAGVDTTGDGLDDSYASDFGILNPILAVEHRGWCVPVRFSGELVKNTRADVSADHGWVAGASLGGASSPGDWKLYYQFQDIGQDALFSPIAQDDFLLRTNYSGHVFGVAHRVLDRVGLHLWTLVAGRNEATGAGGTQDQWRVRLDLDVRL